MGSHQSLRAFVADLLPGQSDCSQSAAGELLRALLLGFTTNLSQLARQTDRSTGARGARQYLGRWLQREQWAPDRLYVRLTRQARRVLLRGRTQPLLLDTTYLSDTWAVLQVSVAWQGRALPVYRLVTRWKDPEWGQTAQVQAVCAWLQQHLPGPRGRYVLVLDRGFPSHLLLRYFQEQGWRYVVRLSAGWKLTHAEHTGPLRDVVAPETRGPVPPHAPPSRWRRWFGDAVLGRRGKGRADWSRTHVVCWEEPGHAETWYLATSERTATQTYAIYRQRMQIEGEFRDLKGPWGLDELARWCDRGRVACFLAWVAAYEWRLAALWEAGQLQDWGRKLIVHGALSWITVTRQWLLSRLRSSQKLALDCL